MTPKEAIEWLKEQRNHYVSSDPYAISLDIAIEVLEKQITTKPINIKSMMSDLKYGECPKCGEGVNDEMCYCSMCGSRLDWSEE